MGNDFLNTRLRRRCHLATELASFSDQRLSTLLNQAKPVHSGIGGTAVVLTIDGTPIFVKKIPLTDLERRPENLFSTANLFKLPLCYQYGVGSTGFGVWRELLAHEMTTNWVLSGECANFPIMYHWRALPDVRAEPIPPEQKDKLEQDVAVLGALPSHQQSPKSLAERLSLSLLVPGIRSAKSLSMVWRAAEKWRRNSRASAFFRHVQA